MNTRYLLRTPDGAELVRDVVDGCWAEPDGVADSTFGQGLVALPGLVDAHAHLASSELYQPGNLDEAVDRSKASLQAGVTLLLDKGWSDTTTVDVIRTVPRDQRPEIEAAARLLANEGGYYPGFGRRIDPSELAVAVEEEVRAAAGWVKLIGDWPRKGVGPQPNFSESELRRAVATAESLGARVAIHTMAHEVPSQAVSAGVHSIEHGLFLTVEDLGLLGGRRGMWVPTLLRNEVTLGQLGSESSGGRLFVEGLDNVRELLPQAVEAGVRVLAGTDLVGSPADVADEALALARYGLSNSQVVEAVSTSAFEATGRSARFQPGSNADAVFFSENPIDELGVLRHPKAVMRMGRQS